MSSIMRWRNGLMVVVIGHSSVIEVFETSMTHSVIDEILGAGRSRRDRTRHKYRAAI